MCGCVISDTRGGESPTANQPTVQKHRGEPDTRDRHTILTNHRKTNLRAHSSDLSPHPHRLTSYARRARPHPRDHTRTAERARRGRHNATKKQSTTGHTTHPIKGFGCIFSYASSFWSGFLQYQMLYVLYVYARSSLYARVVRHDRLAIVRFAVSARPMPDGSQTLPIRRLRLRFRQWPTSDFRRLIFPYLIGIFRGVCATSSEDRHL